MRQLPLCFTTDVDHHPELAPLDILESALSVSEGALIAACAELQHGRPDPCPRDSSVVRANAIILHARRLAHAITAYRDHLYREAHRAERRLRHRNP